MKKFRFRLESLKKIKEHKERERQKEHAAVVQQVMKQQEQLCALEATRLSAMASQRAKQEETGRVSAIALLSYSRYYLKLKREKITGNEVLRALEGEAEIRRQRLVEAARERKTFEKLKERQFDKFLKSTELVLTKENDEVAANTVRRHKA
jgi:flagellar FliJ protein